MKPEDMLGRKYGRLTVLYRVDDHIAPSGRNEAMMLCRCECGQITTARTTSLRSGNKKSCGCLRSEKSSERRRTHNGSKSKLYRVWQAMKRRCADVTDRNYGGKGITVCEEWMSFDNFKLWSEENGYCEGLTIDRIDGDLGYLPDNCRWVNRKIQNNNTSRNHLITFNGETKTMAQWSEDTGISYAALKTRLNRRGWSVERALTTPVM